MADALPYPPPRHALRDLRLAVDHRSEGVSVMRMPVDDHLRGHDGAVRAGVLAFLVDVIGGGLAALTVAPDWIATADLTLHVARRARGSAVEATARVLRAGRTTVVLEVDLGDDAGPCGVATMSFARLARRDRVNPVVARDEEGSLRMDLGADGPGFGRPIDDALGIELVDAAAGATVMPVSDYVRNSFGAVQGGVITTLVDGAARAALGHACGRPVDAVDLHVTYLALGREGPVRSSAAVLGATPSGGTARIDLLDTGSDRTMTRARVTAVAPEAWAER